MKRKVSIIICLLILIFIAGTFQYSTNVFAASKETKNLQKLQKKLKKKVTKSYKTDNPELSGIKENYYQHRVSIYKKGKKLIFTDRIAETLEGEKNAVNNIKMSLNIGKNKKVKITVKRTEYISNYDENEKLKGYTATPTATYTTMINSVKYNDEMALKFKIVKRPKSNWSYDDPSVCTYPVYKAFQCWNKLSKKTANVSMKSIGFKKFK